MNRQLEHSGFHSSLYCTSLITTAGLIGRYDPEWSMDPPQSQILETTLQYICSHLCSVSVQMCNTASRMRCKQYKYLSCDLWGGRRRLAVQLVAFAVLPRYNFRWNQWQKHKQVGIRKRERRGSKEGKRDLQKEIKHYGVILILIWIIFFDPWIHRKSLMFWTLTIILPSDR